MSQLNLRNKPRISYYEPDEPNLDEYVFCSHCGDFVYEFCSIHGPLLVIPDDKINDYNNKRAHVIDAEDPNKSNWMRYVNCSRHWYEQNLIAYQYRGRLYYRTIKIIPRYTELMVFYGSEFAHMLQINLKMYNAPSSYAQKFGASPLKYSSLEENKHNEISLSTKCEEEKSIKSLPNIKNLSKLSNIKKNKVSKDVPETHLKTIQSPHKKVKFITPKKIQKDEIKTPKPSNKRKKYKLNSKNITSIKKKQTTEISLKSNETKISIKSCDFNNNENVKTKSLEPLSKKSNKIVEKTSKENESDREVSYLEKNNIDNKSSELKVDDSFLSKTLVQNIFSCDKCNFKTSLERALKVHLLAHGAKTKYACTYCDYITEYKRPLIVHIRTHTRERPHACNLCDKKFNQKNSLNLHIRTHTGERPYACKFCDKKFNRKNSLNLHIRTHTGEKPHACKFCDKKFNQKNNLNVHIRTHTGERPYACKFCDKKFNRKNSLNLHIRTHTGEKPHACKFCDKKFNQKNNLNVHIRTHTGEKPHACNFCDQKFNHKINLNRHKKTHIIP